MGCKISNVKNTLEITSELIVGDGMNSIVAGCWVWIYGDHRDERHLVMSVDESGNVTLSDGSVVSEQICVVMEN